MLREATMLMIGAIAIASPSQAKIVCKDGYQRVNGNEIATPYCQDKLVAQVARQYGARVSDNAILYNPSAKEDACRFVGHDNRLTTACAGYNDRGRRF
jgi:hypothetical protein